MRNAKRSRNLFAGEIVEVKEHRDLAQLRGEFAERSPDVESDCPVVCSNLVPLFGHPTGATTYQRGFTHDNAIEPRFECVNATQAADLAIHGHAGFLGRVLRKPAIAGDHRRKPKACGPDGGDKLIDGGFVTCKCGSNCFRGRPTSHRPPSRRSFSSTKRGRPLEMSRASRLESRFP